MTMTSRIATYATLIALLGTTPTVRPAFAADESADEQTDDSDSARQDLRRKRLEQIDRFRRFQKGPAGVKVRGQGDREDGAQAEARQTPTPEPDEAEPEVETNAEAASSTPAPRRRETNEHRKLRPNDKVRFEFAEDAELEAVIKEIAAMTGYNFIFDKKDIRNHKVTILVETPITRAEAYQTFLSALEAAGLTTVWIGQNMIKIIPRRDAIQKPVDTRAGTSVPYHDAFVTRIIQLDNISVQDAQQVVSSLVAKDGNATPFAPTNTFIITDSANNIRRIVKIIEELDRAGADLTIQTVPIKYAEAAQVAEIIEQLFGDGGDNGGQRGLRRPARRTIRRRNAKTNAEPTGESGLAISNVIPDERTNQLIIQASKTAFPAIMQVIEEIDTPVRGDGNERIHVYYLENANAPDVANVLSTLSNGAGAAGRAQTPRRGGAVGNRNAANDDGGGTAVADILSGDVKVTADEATNSLVIVASRADYDVLRGVIKKLDIRRRQVFVEAVIADISVSRSRDFNISFALGGTAAPGTPIFGGFNPTNVLVPDPTTLGSGLAMGLIGPQKIPFTVTDPTTGTQQTLMLPPFGVILQALESDSDTNVLSRPTVLATENEEAEFISATSVAFQGSTTISQTGLQNFAITREDVGITLRVTPKVTESEYVTLDIFQEVKNIAKDQVLANGQRLIDTAKRSAKTTVVAKDGQTVVLGGLISDEDTVSESKVPLLGDIPFLGLLFRTEKRNRNKSNLVIFLTPHIVRDEADMQDIYEQKWEERQLFLKLYANRVQRKEDKRKWTMYDRYYSHREKPAEDDRKNDEPVPEIPVEPPRMTPPTETESGDVPVEDEVDPNAVPDETDDASAPVGQDEDEPLYPDDGGQEE